MSFILPSCPGNISDLKITSLFVLSYIQIYVNRRLGRGEKAELRCAVISLIVVSFYIVKHILYKIKLAGTDRHPEPRMGKVSQIPSQIESFIRL